MEVTAADVAPERKKLDRLEVAAVNVLEFGLYRRPIRLVSANKLLPSLLYTLSVLHQKLHVLFLKRPQFSDIEMSCI